MTKLRWRSRQEENAGGEVERPRSVLGPGLKASGRIDSIGEIHIHGTVRGDVCAFRVVLCADGFVEGNLAAREAVVEGKLKGRVFAFSVVIESSAEIEGHVFHHELAVAPGARLEGRTPWRPVNYFDNISETFQGDIDEHVQPQR